VELLRAICFVASVLLLGGCVHSRIPPARTLAYPADVFAFTNQTYWVYGRDSATGQQTHVKRDPKPDYALHCFAMARAAREFLWHARFDATAPKVDEEAYRRLVREIVGRSSRAASAEESKVVIPGYASLFDFSREYDSLLKATCGGASGSYWQRGNWRMVFPFSRSGQAREASRLLEGIRLGRPAIVHLVCFPSLTLNHAVVLFAAQEDDSSIRFQAYDPNSLAAPLSLTFDKSSRRFQIPPTHYFVGGPVNVYEVYRGICY
jgi:hypothetical protein